MSFPPVKGCHLMSSSGSGRLFSEVDPLGSAGQECFFFLFFFQEVLLHLSALTEQRAIRVVPRTPNMILLLHNSTDGCVLGAEQLPLRTLLPSNFPSGLCTDSPSQGFLLLSAEKKKIMHKTLIFAFTALNRVSEEAVRWKILRRQSSFLNE